MHRARPIANPIYQHSLSCLGLRLRFDSDARVILVWYLYRCPFRVPGLVCPQVVWIFKKKGKEYIYIYTHTQSALSSFEGEEKQLLDKRNV